jgi:hypothetical protein
MRPKDAKMRMKKELYERGEKRRREQDKRLYELKRLGGRERLKR